MTDALEPATVDAQQLAAPRGAVVPEADAGAGTWRKLDGPDDLVEFYDPTDVFGDLADTLAEAFPALGEPAGTSDEDGEGDGEDGGEEDEADVGG